jgi:hypothetical protein
MRPGTRSRKLGRLPGTGRESAHPCASGDGPRLEDAGVHVLQGDARPGFPALPASCAGAIVTIKSATRRYGACFVSFLDPRHSLNRDAACGFLSALRRFGLETHDFK